MGEGLKQRYHGVHLPGDEDDEELFDSDSFSSGEEDYYAEDDATSSSPNPSSPSSKSSSLTPKLNQSGSLYQLSSLMDELPIKRGLSKFYQGKSQSYTSLSAVSSIEDLPKKGVPYKRKMMKTCKSYAGGLDASHSKTISKKSPRVPSCASLMSKSSSSSLLFSSKPPLFPVQKNPCTH
ncbi:hypothetical protein Cni_G04407 [Canna indica]|uniref:Oxidative stress 3 n=1 Tax=Canna indica TaxID=4628 RepID=A0AAQ3Q271_9LILI|nr:hypothetical protein Cni_G04407 [Canna indica]